MRLVQFQPRAIGWISIVIFLSIPVNRPEQGSRRTSPDHYRTKLGGGMVASIPPPPVLAGTRQVASMISSSIPTELFVVAYYSRRSETKRVWLRASTGVTVSC